MESAPYNVLGEATTAPVLPLTREITAEELKKEWDDMSATLAHELRSTICDIHESCDGSCSGGAGQAPPSTNNSTSLPSVQISATNPRPSIATAQDFPRDLYWLDQQKLSKHKYAPINSGTGDIRLLKVKKALFRTDVVECELVTTSLDQATPYQALSYCCGTAGMTEVMLCNGSKHLIYPSLNNALKAFRQSEYQDFHLWTDAVSINQADKAELSEQIPLMRRIYAEAIGVFVYLGEADRQFSQGLDLLHRLAILQQHIDDPESRGALSTDVDVQEIVLPWNHPDWTEYLKIFISPWFLRTWILQEIALAKVAVVAVGRSLTPWYALDQSVRLLCQLRSNALFLRIMPHLDFKQGWDNFIEIQQMIRLLRTPGLTLFEVLKKTNNFEVSDQRDKIIGVLGLVKDTARELSALSDYRLTKAQIYQKTALYLLRTDVPELTIEYAGRQRRIGLSDMPSWVPDWHDHFSISPVSAFIKPSCKAGGKNPMSLWPEGDAPYPSSISVHGLCHHKIIKQSDAYCPLVWERNRHNSDGTDPYRRWLASAQDCLRSSDRLAYDDLEDAFARALIGDNTVMSVSLLNNLPQIHDPLPSFRSAFLRLEEMDGSAQPTSSLLKKLIGVGGDQPEAYIVRMTAVMNNRRLAITDTGYMCLVPEWSNLGDEVAIFLGFRVPYIIRPQSEFTTVKEGQEQVRAQLVGDAYIHGLMDGEAVEIAARTGRPHFQITLV